MAEDSCARVSSTFSGAAHRRLLCDFGVSKGVIASDNAGSHRVNTPCFRWEYCDSERYSGKFPRESSRFHRHRVQDLPPKPVDLFARELGDENPLGTGSFDPSRVPGDHPLLANDDLARSCREARSARYADLCARRKELVKLTSWRRKTPCKESPRRPIDPYAVDLQQHHLLRRQQPFQDLVQTFWRKPDDLPQAVEGDADRPGLRYQRRKILGSGGFVRAMFQPVMKRDSPHDLSMIVEVLPAIPWITSESGEAAASGNGS